jgi:cell shape-determining protein MreC
VVVILAALVLLGASPASRFVAAGVHSLGRIFWPVRQKAADELTATVAPFITSKESLVRENLKLKEEMAKLRAQQLVFQAVLGENRELKENFGRDDLGPVVLASILVRPPASAYDTMVIDRGSESRLAPGLKVIVGSAALGEIVEMYPSTSLVRLYSAPGEKTEGVLAASGTPVTLLGRGGGTFELRLPRDIAVAAGDIVTLPGSPPLALAVVESVASRPADAYALVLARVPVNIFSMRFVAIQP